jgi:hypothetical protein
VEVIKHFGFWTKTGTLKEFYSNLTVGKKPYTQYSTEIEVKG